MAKKLGILALVVCMLLSIAAVASAADWTQLPDGRKQPATNTKNPQGDMETTTCDSAQAKLIEIGGYNAGLTYSENKHFYGLAPDDTVVEKDGDGTAVEGKKAGDENGKYITLAEWRKSDQGKKLAKADEAYQFTGSTNGSPVNSGDFAVDRDDDTKVTTHKNGWERTDDGDHAKFRAATWTRKCILCLKKEEVIVATPHTPVAAEDAETTLAATCITGGTVSKAECSVCHMTKEEPTATLPLGHNWANKTIELSCTIAGGHGDICSRCGQVSADSQGHKYGTADFIDSEYSAGDKEDTAKNFAYDGDNPWVANVGEPQGHQWELKTEITSAAGTVYVANDDLTKLAPKSPAYVKDSATHLHADVVYVCTRANCDKNKGTKNTIKIGITDKTGTLGYADDGKVTLTISSAADCVTANATRKQPTCELTGRDSYVCPLCKAEIVTVVVQNAPASGHVPGGSFFHDNTTHESYDAADFKGNTTQSMHYQFCTVCGQKVVSKCDEGKGQWLHEKIDANCTTGASIIYSCKDCGYKENVADPSSKKLSADEVTSYTLHYGYMVNDESLKEEDLAKWTTKKVTKAATCTTAGTTEYTCKNCKKLALTLAVAGEHDMVQKSTELKSCDQQWIEIWVCSRSDCPGVSVKVDEKGTETRNGAELTWNATVQTIDGKAGQRRVYNAVDHTYNGKFEVVKEPTCVADGERYPICDVCGQKGPKDTTYTKTGDHQYTPLKEYVEADCTHPARMGSVCKVCGQPNPADTVTNVPGSSPNGHKFANPTYYKDKPAAEAHKPGTEIEQPTDCQTGYAIRTVCTVCGADNVEVHTAGKHTWSDERVHKAPNCTENDRDVYVCTVCGAENPTGKIDNYLNAGGYGIADESLAKTGHTWGDWAILTDDGITKHQHTCTVCGHKTDAEECNFEDDKDASKDATCVNVAVYVQTCSVCKNQVVTYGTDLDPDNHDFEDVPLEGHEPTCTERGTVVETCPYCGATGKTKEIDPLGHAWERKTGDWTTGLVITQEPTCVADGVAHRECSICGFTTEDFTVGKYDGANTQFGHTWTRADYVWSADQLFIDVEPTCTVDGTGHYVCADCGYELTTGIPHYDGASTPWGHTWNRPDYVWSIDQLTISTEPTCVADGEGYYECSDCGYKLVVPVPHYDGANTPYGHVWAHEAWPAGLVVNEDGTYYYQCSDCGYLFQEQ